MSVTTREPSLHKTVRALLAVSLLALAGYAQSVPPLINYQGMLTGQTGSALAAGPYTIQFRLWDSGTATNAGDLIWGQQQNITVQANGVFNVILGSPGGSAIPGTTPAVNNLAYAFASSNVFLGVTIAVSNGVAVSSPSEILPRQQLLSVPFAFSAVNANSALSASSASVASSVLPGSIVNASLASGIVTLTNLAPRPIGTNVSVGGIAVGGKISVGNACCESFPQFSITITTVGRPVLVFLAPADGTSPCYLFSDQDTEGQIALQRDGANVGMYLCGCGNSSINWFSVPGSLLLLDTPAAGTHTYMLASIAGSGLTINNAKLVAFEL
jgi:hypothetical protein